MKNPFKRSAPVARPADMVLPLPGYWAVMCCGCRRFLAEAGEKGQHVGGMTDWKKGPARPADTIRQWNLSLSGAAKFDSPEAADKAARAAGWQTDDEQGPGNHRCPDCLAGNQVKVRTRGAYVFIPEGNR